MKCLAKTNMCFICVAQSYSFYQRNRITVHGGKLDTLSEAVVSFRTVVTFVKWLISNTEFSEQWDTLSEAVVSLIMMITFIITRGKIMQ